MPFSEHSQHTPRFPLFLEATATDPKRCMTAGRWADVPGGDVFSCWTWVQRFISTDPSSLDLIYLFPYAFPFP